MKIEQATLSRLTAVVLMALTCAAHAESVGQSHAVIVSGLPATPVHAHRFRDWSVRMHAYLTKQAGIPANNVAVFSGDPKFTGSMISGKATREHVLDALRQLSDKLGPADQFILVMIGHGDAHDSDEAKYALPGLDLSAADLAKALEPIRSKNQVVIDLTSASGDAVASLSHPNRVVIAATSPNEDQTSVFGEFFLRGLERGTADGEAAPDGGRADKIITMLEAFNHAAHENALWIRRIWAYSPPKDENAPVETIDPTASTRINTKQWRVEGRESVALFRKLFTVPQDAPGSKQLSQTSKPRQDDAINPLVTVAEDPKTQRRFHGIRQLTEHATLEDAGQEVGIAAVRGGKYQPIAGQAAGEPGAHARRVVLGRPGLLPAPKVTTPSAAQGE